MIVRSFDFISPLITLYYKGETRHSSIFSGLISIILIILVLYICIFISFDFIFKMNPNSFYFIMNIKDVGTIKLSHNFFFHYISFLDEYTKKDVFDEKVFSVIGINKNSFNSFIFKEHSEYNVSHWKYERCKNLNLKKLNATKYSTIKKYFNDSLCISKYYNYETNKIISVEDENFPFPLLENNVENEKFKEYQIIFKQCENNSLYNNNSCYELKTIKRKVENYIMSYYFNYYTNYIDVENYKEPIVYELTNKSFNYDPYLIYTNEINLRQTYVRTSDGIIFDKRKILKTYNIDNILSNYEYNFYDLFLSMIEIKMLNKVEVYHRDYKKIQDIAGSVDGMIELVIFIIEFINNFFYHDFRIVNDFNKMIEKKVDKIRTSKININNSSSLKLLNSKIDLNNYIFKPKIKKLGTQKQTMTPIRNSSKFKKDNNEIQTPEIKNKFDRKMTQNFQKFSWGEFMLNYISCILKKKYKYFGNILLLRKKILSEERLLKNHWKIKNINQEFIEIKSKSFNQIYNSEYDKKNQIYNSIIKN